jgi:two-component system, chemotaxis family, chemotaxis protein CheY
MSYTILVTDDASMMRSVIKRTIQLSGVPVQELVEATNGQQALDTIRSRKIDFVFLDLNMPVMGGIEMVEQLRKDPVHGKTPVCIVSSESTLSRVAQLRAAGVQGYVKKPFTPEQIREVIMSNLQISEAA